MKHQKGFGIQTHARTVYLETVLKNKTDGLFLGMI